MENQLNRASIAQKCISKLMAPIALWLIKSGVGYKDFDNSIKRIFYEQAIKESKKHGYKITDSSLSLLAGLNRRDIIFFKEHPTISENTQTMSISSRIITLWVQKKWKTTIPITGENISFEKLSKEISQDTHPKTVLLELERLGLIKIDNHNAVLLSESFTPSKDSDKCQPLLSRAVTDHINSGLVNIFNTPNSHLQQALYVDSLSKESVKELAATSEKLWKNMSSELLDKAVELSNKDIENDDADYRFTLGIYEYHEKQSH